MIGIVMLSSILNFVSMASIIMLMASVSMIKKTTDNSVSEEKQAYYKTFIQGIVIGTITGIIGAGGGFLFVPALVLWGKIPMKKAVGTSLVIITVNSLIGFIGDIQTLDIDWFFLLTFTFISTIGIVLGVFLSKFISAKKLKKSFGVFTLVIAIYIIYKELS